MIADGWILHLQHRLPLQQVKMCLMTEQTYLAAFGFPEFWPDFLHLIGVLTIQIWPLHKFTLAVTGTTPLNVQEL